jgi:CTP:phosphocholine cytidylyltransferase-like protein
MKSTENLYVFWHDTITKTLFQFFGSYDVSSEQLWENCSIYFIDDFRIDIERSWNGVLFSVDLREIWSNWRSPLRIKIAHGCD